MDNAAKKKKKRKPLRRAQRWQSRVLPMAMKLLVPLMAIIIMGLVCFKQYQTDQTPGRVSEYTFGDPAAAGGDEATSEDSGYTEEEEESSGESEDYADEEE